MTVISLRPRDEVGQNLLPLVPAAGVAGLDAITVAVMT
ncbi:Uncharacterized protein ABJ99_3771 [Pseudomonas syringae pv. cilantro]|uniref:Uncharacterized protein n=1 Tax=Pseudomonas syringae pv. cilantro TaxID=81035 RepID=A0A0N0X9X5_PSESX|nr:Uncharacterized protein ABJ99_3771 [Pseudomonas syringae pv. cilantro]